MYAPIVTKLRPAASAPDAPKIVMLSNLRNTLRRSLLRVIRQSRINK